MIAFNDNPGGVPTLANIETLAGGFASAYTEAADIMDAIRREQEAVKQKYLPHLRTAVERAKSAKSELFTAVTLAPQLFEKPRTLVLHGVKVGYQKAKGGIEIEDADRTLALIRRHLGQDALAYIKIKETPDKRMLAELPVGELKKLGCTVTDTGDEVVIRHTRDEIEKAVDALLADPAEKEAA